MKRQKRVFLTKLSSKNTFIIIGINTLLPLMAVPFAYWAVQRHGDVQQAAISVGDYNRTMFLTLLLLAVIIFTINIIFFFNPLVKLETVIQNYKEADTITMDFDIIGSDSSLENMFFDLLQEQKETMEQIYASEMLRQQTELMVLQSQINPHFLYNTLDSIRGLAMMHDIPEIADMTEALSKLFRSMIANGGRLIPLREELKSVENYMVIQNFRFSQRFQYHNRIGDENILSCLVPNLILQPLVENAIIHGMEKKIGPGNIIVSAYVTSKRLILTIEDDGLGMDEGVLSKLNETLSRKTVPPVHNARYHSIALTNISQRIRLEFGEQYGIHVMSTPNILTVVEIALPYLENEKKDLDHAKRNIADGANYHN